MKAYQQSRHHAVSIPKGSTSYLFESLAGKCPLTNLMSVNDLIETFKHRAFRLLFLLLRAYFKLYCFENVLNFFCKCMIMLVWMQSLV